MLSINIYNNRSYSQIVVGLYGRMTAHVAIVNGAATIWMKVTILYFCHRIGTIMKRFPLSNDLVMSETSIVSKIEKSWADWSGLRFPHGSSN
jgi:hypothetical protein